MLSYWAYVVSVEFTKINFFSFFDRKTILLGAGGGSELSDRFSTQTDGYLMSNDGRRRKNLAGDNLIDGDEATDPVGGFGNIFRTAIAASGAVRVPGLWPSSVFILVLLSHALVRTWLVRNDVK